MLCCIKWAGIIFDESLPKEGNEKGMSVPRAIDEIKYESFKEDAALFSNKKKITFLLILLAVLLITMAAAITFGAYNITIGVVYQVVLSHLHLNSGQVKSLYNTIVWDLRIPRILLSATVGMALASAGTVYQGTFKNPLVEPFILGVSAGAAFGAALAIVFPGLLPIQVSAFIFGMISVFGAYSLARVRGETPLVTLILAGVIIGSLFSAAVSILKYIASDAGLREITF